MTSPHPGPLWLRFADRPARAMILTGLAATLLVGIFAVTYAGRVANDRAFWPGLTLLLVALGLRLAAAIQSVRLRSSTLPTE